MQKIVLSATGQVGVLGVLKRSTQTSQGFRIREGGLFFVGKWCAVGHTRRLWGLSFVFWSSGVGLSTHGFQWCDNVYFLNFNGGMRQRGLEIGGSPWCFSSQPGDAVLFDSNFLSHGAPESKGDRAKRLVGVFVVQWSYLRLHGLAVGKGNILPNKTCILSCDLVLLSDVNNDASAIENIIGATENVKGATETL